MISIPASDAAKIGVMVGAFLAIYWFSRWGSRQTEAVPPPPPLPDPEPLSLPTKTTQRWANIVPINSRSEDLRAEPLNEEILLPIRITKVYFANFDYLPGPPDPSVFADELFVELYDPDSDYRWTNTYFVATPQGLDEMLEREHWKYAYADQVFFVTRYDPKVVREMLIEKLRGSQERPKPSTEPGDSDT